MRNAQVPPHARVEFRDFREVVVEKREQIELRADRALDAARRVIRDQRLEFPEGDEHVFAEHREALAERRQLRRDVVRARRDRHVARFRRALRESPNRRDRLEPNVLERTENLQLLDGFRQVARGHAFVNVLAAGERAEFLDARLDVVSRHAFPRIDGRRVDVVLHALVGLNRLLGNVQPQVALRAHHRDPKFALENDFPPRRPNVSDRLRRVALRQNVCNLFHMRKSEKMRTLSRARRSREQKNTRERRFSAGKLTRKTAKRAAENSCVCARKQVLQKKIISASAFSRVPAEKLTAAKENPAVPAAAGTGRAKTAAGNSRRRGRNPRCGDARESRRPPSRAR